LAFLLDRLLEKKTQGSQASLFQPRSLDSPPDRPKTPEVDLGGPKHRGVAAGKRAGASDRFRPENQLLVAVET